MSKKQTKTKDARQEKQRARRNRARGREGQGSQYEDPDLLAVQRAVANPAPPSPADILALQRTVGNRTVQRLLAQRQGDEEGFDLDDETAGRINRARGGGRPLDSTVQEQMSASQGYDFSGVRVHTGPEADALNQEFGARAFTTGQDIFFRQGEYNPGSGSGQELIAHELTHVVQQTMGKVGVDGRGMTVRPGGDAFEQEAKAVSRAVAGLGYQVGREKEERGSQRGTIPTGPLPAAKLSIQRSVDPNEMLPQSLCGETVGEFTVDSMPRDQSGANRYSRLALYRSAYDDEPGNPQRDRSVTGSGLLCSQAVAIAKKNPDLVFEGQQSQAQGHRMLWRSADRKLRGHPDEITPEMAVAARVETGHEVSFWDGGVCTHIGVHAGGGNVSGYNQHAAVTDGGLAGEHNSGYPDGTKDIRVEG